MTIFPATISKHGYPRPFVPFEASFGCVDCKTRHYISGSALADSGADRAIFPASSMWPEHGMSWGSLPLAGRRRHDGSDRVIEMRLWPLDVKVLGVTIATSVMVAEPGAAPIHPVLGLAELFSRFVVTFYWGHTPPAFGLEPLGGATDHPALLPLPTEAMALHYSLEAPNAPLRVSTPPRPQISAGGDAIDRAIRAVERDP